MRRLLDEWKLLSSVFIGILVAVTISVGSTVYLTALEQLAFKVSLNQIAAPLLNLSVYAKRIPLTSEAVDDLDGLVASIATEHIEDLYAGHEIYLRGTSAIVTTMPPIPGAIVRISSVMSRINTGLLYCCIGCCVFPVYWFARCVSATLSTLPTTVLGRWSTK